MNFKTVMKNWIMGALWLGLFWGCSVDADDPAPGEKTFYLVQISTGFQDSKGVIRAYESFPNGIIVVHDSLSFQGQGMRGWRTFDNWIYKMYSSESGKRGIEKLRVGADGVIRAEHFLPVDETVPGSGNFVIVNHETGYYWDAATPFQLHQFNPLTLERIAGWDLSEAINERGAGVEDIGFRAIGQRLLAVKGGKLFADISYAKSKGEGNQLGEPYYSSAYLAIMDLATSKWEKTIEIPDMSFGEVIYDQPMHAVDGSGNLYFVVKGASGASLLRINADDTEIDTSWVENIASEFTFPQIVSLWAKDDRLIVLSGQHEGENQGEGAYYLLDITSKTSRKIGGIPPVTISGGAQHIVEVNGRVFLRVVSPDASQNGYYELQDQQAKKEFEIQEGGIVQGFYKVKAE